ncbi:MAG: DUF2155 domain-containing protein [Rhizomicrobium sp.]
MRIPKAIALCGAALAFAGSVFAAPAAKPKPAKPAAVVALPPKPVGPMTLIMRGLDKITGRPTTLLIPIGKSVQFATLTVAARYCYSTPSTETPETAAFVQIDDQRPDQPRRRVFSGWMYASSPGLNGMQHPLYDVWVMTCRPVAPGETVVIGPVKPVKPVSPDAPETERPVALPEDASQ